MVGFSCNSLAHSCAGGFTQAYQEQSTSGAPPIGPHSLSSLQKMILISIFKPGKRLKERLFVLRHGAPPKKTRLNGSVLVWHPSTSPSALSLFLLRSLLTPRHQRQTIIWRKPRNPKRPRRSQKLPQTTRRLVLLLKISHFSPSHTRHDRFLEARIQCEEAE